MTTALNLDKLDNSAGQAANQVNENFRKEVGSPWPKIGTNTIITAIAIFLFYAWGVDGTNFNLIELAKGSESIVNFADNMFEYPYATIGGVTTTERQIRRAGELQFNSDGTPKMQEVYIPTGFARAVDRIPVIGWFIDAQDTNNDNIPDAAVLSGPDFDINEFANYDIPLVKYFVPSKDEIRELEAAQNVTVTPWTINMPEAFPKVIETLQMAIIGTSFAVVFSLFFGYLAAKNMAPRRWIYQTIRLLLNFNRALPEIIWALIFVSAVGLGPFAGSLALAVASVGSLGKLFAEAFESIDPQQVMAVEATGAGNVLSFLFGVVPQAAPLIASYSLLFFESNVRRASILGIVGAGGIGFLLDKYVRLFQYSKLMGALVILIIMVTLIDRLSDYIRTKLI